MEEIVLSKSSRKKHFLPGFGLTFGYSIFYLSIILMIPISMIFIKTTSLSWSKFIDTVTDPRVLAAYQLSFYTSLSAAVINTIFGFLVAWVLVRYNFPFKKMIDALVDLPFALPTAVAGISLTTIFSPNGIIGGFLESLGFKLIFTPLGIIIALTFISMPFVVRTIQPVLAEFEGALEEAAASFNASRFQIFIKIIFPEIKGALITGFTLAFARSLGEYGSVVFISGNMPMKTEIAPLLIMTKLEQFDYAGATSVAVVMLSMSFILLLGINLLQWKMKKI
jgi:sulfate/thiosulfate transport system permease protein